MGKQLFLGRRPKPALLFLIAEKEGKKASPLGTYKTYFEPGVLQPFYQGLHPLPALLFFIAKKVSKKASTPGSHKIYFYPGILQLPTVGQVKCLYTPLKINFIGGFKGVRKQQQQRQKQKGKITKAPPVNRLARRGKIKISKKQ